MVVERADEQLMTVVGDTRVDSANGVVVSNTTFQEGVSPSLVTSSGGFQLLRFSSQDYGLISSTPFGYLGSCLGWEGFARAQHFNEGGARRNHK